MRRLTPEDVANVLRCMSSHEPVNGVVFDEKDQGLIEAGRCHVLMWLAEQLDPLTAHSRDGA